MNVQYRGILKMEPDLKASHLKHLTQFLGKDIRNFPNWEKNEYYHKLHYSIDLELTPDFEGLRWNGDIRTCEMIPQINYLITQMKETCPEFKLLGKFELHEIGKGKIGEIVFDENGFAKELKDIPPSGQEITCPHCKQTFFQL
jgi:hypothetical protein